MRLLFIIVFLISNYCYSQVVQTHRFELEKKNNDDYFTVLPAGEDGVIIFRDTDKYDKGNVLNIVLLDTALNEIWNKELSIDNKYEFKGYDIKNSSLYLLYREGSSIKNDYHLMAISLKDGGINRYDIKNEVSIELSHITVLPEGVVMAGYVNFSPTLIIYTFGDDKFEVVPGFFKDRSIVVDLKDNGNSTFNVITLEEDYNGSYLRFRTYSYDGDILFEREVMKDGNYKILNARSSGFIDGNVVVTGTYSVSNSYYAAGIYVAIVKPEGQDNIIKYHELYSLEHFFDYMKPRRANRIKNKMKRRLDKGKDVHYTSRLSINNIQKTKKGYLISGEMYDPEYRIQNYYGYNNGLLDHEEMERRSEASQTYSKQPTRIHNLDQATGFEYVEGIVLETDRAGEILWDNSLKIKDVDMPILEQVLQVEQYQGLVNMIYLNEESVCYKVVQQTDVVEEGQLPIKLLNNDDEIIHTYHGVGKSEYWYDNNFIIWGYHRVDSHVPAIPKRSVLYVNKVIFK